MSTHRSRQPEAQFLKSVPRWRPSEDDGRPQIAVGGRSNVGKSSLINRLLGRKGLARTSSTPGRTQALNYFEVDRTWVLVDLPGHGYAKAPRDVIRQWQQNTREYLARAESLVGVVVLIDVRRDPTADDMELLRMARQVGRQAVVVVTKADKVGRGERVRRCQMLARSLGSSGHQLLITSARTGEGIEEVWQKIHGWLPSEPVGSS